MLGRCWGIRWLLVPFAGNKQHQLNFVQSILYTQALMMFDSYMLKQCIIKKKKKKKVRIHIFKYIFLLLLQDRTASEELPKFEMHRGECHGAVGGQQGAGGRTEGWVLWSPWWGLSGAAEQLHGGDCAWHGVGRDLDTAVLPRYCIAQS